MGLRPTHWDENGVELCVYADGAWTAKVCLHSGSSEAVFEFDQECAFEPICVAPLLPEAGVGST
jgi:hypothetical protein